MEAADAKPVPDFIVLADECSKWKSEVYLEVTKEVPGMPSHRISGTFQSRVFEGPYRDSAKWYQTVREGFQAQGKALGKIYAYYTTCPGCAKEYGKNYVVLLAQVD